MCFGDFKMKEIMSSIKLIIIYCTLVYFQILIQADPNVKCSLTKVWGPGLDPENIVLPARYFFIEAMNENNTTLVLVIVFLTFSFQISYILFICSLNKSPGSVFSVEIEGQSGKSCRVWSNILDRKDGSFIVRYKLYEPCSRILISVKCNGEELPNFPYEFSGN